MVLNPSGKNYRSPVDGKIECPASRIYKHLPVHLMTIFERLQSTPTIFYQRLMSSPIYGCRPSRINQVVDTTDLERSRVVHHHGQDAAETNFAGLPRWILLFAFVASAILTRDRVFPSYYSLLFTFFSACLVYPLYQSVPYKQPRLCSIGTSHFRFP